MQDWIRNRGCAYNPSFQEALKRRGISERDWDSYLAPFVDESLWGASDEKLDNEYPPLAGRLRMLFTEPYREFPALRIAFYVDDGDNGKIVYVDVDTR